MFILCAVVVERIVGPKDLQVSELSYSSLQLTWSQATGDVTGYRLLITPVSPKGHLLPAQQRQVRHAHLSICTPHAAQQMEGCTWTTFVYEAMLIMYLQVFVCMVCSEYILFFFSISD